MSDRDYWYPPYYTVLRNRLDIRDAAALEAAERELVALRLLEPVPAGDFDLDHLKAIHRHLFQDVYAWAGDVRTVEIAKGESRFQPQRFIAASMADIYRRIVAAGYFRGPGSGSTSSPTGRATAPPGTCSDSWSLPAFPSPFAPGAPEPFRARRP